MSNRTAQPPPHPAAYAPAREAIPDEGLAEADPADNWRSNLDQTEFDLLAIATIVASQYPKAGVAGLFSYKLIYKLSVWLDQLWGIDTDTTPTPSAPQSQPQAVTRPTTPPPPRNAPQRPPQAQSGNGSEAPKTYVIKDPNAAHSEAQDKAIFAIGRRARLTESQIDDIAIQMFEHNTIQLTKAEASELIDYLKAQA